MSHHHPSRAFPSALHHARHSRQRRVSAGAAERARVVASLLAASHALPADPDGAALLLDGALSLLLDLWAQAARLHLHDRRLALQALDQSAPALAGRVRLALQAHDPAARLAHCWALLDLMTGTTQLITSRRATGAKADIHHSRPGHDRHSDDQVTESRKDGESHVR